MSSVKRSESLPLQSVGVLRTPFAEKFGIPRQPNLVAAEGCLQFLPPFDDSAAVRGLERVSHVWVIWQFHGCPASAGDAWQPTVRPPRLGGNQRLGVFATRSGFRPNRIGLSVCELLGINADGSLRLRGVDMLDGTPVLDVKPYVPYADAIADACMEWAQLAPEPLIVKWSEGLEHDALTTQHRALIEGVLAQDPRPAYQEDSREYGLTLAGWNVRFRVERSTAIIVSLTAIGADS